MNPSILKKIDKLIDDNQFDEALETCNQLLDDGASDKAEVFRKRAYFYAVQSNYKDALEDRESAINLDPYHLPDYFQSGWYALSDGNFTLACSYLECVINMSREQNEDWFLGGSYFLLAYSNMKLRNYNQALDYLLQAEKIEADIGYILPDASGVVTSHQLRAKILNSK